ncbi:hypothetical protein BJ170DRAFT_225070 [Xylariales sp. AK1849]|nr:hypothetical protein BJ170DRAFT_225070 [Xylariales sp. AK1849]
MAETVRSSGGDLGSREEHLQTTSSTTHQPSKLSDAVEMDNLSPKPQDTTALPAGSSASHAENPTQTTNAAQIPLTDKDVSTTIEPSAGEHAPAVPSAKALGKAPAITAPATEQDAIGPADSGQADSAAETPGDLTVDIMLIVPTTGARHPFRINEKYLTKRNVQVTSLTEDGKIDPFSITVYTLKELILREWRKEWETPPREPTSIRLIKMGKMLDDKLPLREYNFTPTVKSIVHMSVKPQDYVDEEEANKRLKEPGTQSGGRGCCVIL